MNNKKTLLATTVAGLIALTGMSAQAAELTVKITNLTHGITYTPILLASHDEAVHLFESGTAASPALEMMAEGGDLTGLLAEATGETLATAGVLAPGANTDWFTFDAKEDTHLSLTTMLLPTNDAFAGIDGWEIPTEAGTYTILVNAYDAGTEANSEMLADFPGAFPGRDSLPTGGSGVTSVITNPTVHIHPGNIGDSSDSAGLSDVDNKVHRWLNPVLKVSVIVE